ncbi:PEP/pyruvate-binding domain-containing protein [Nocardia neocaledoniensis]|uniref:PEP/pyruvate-binding domain-containing protein n=1 Tax=Nocardia neocaledoniensis TaxID=236511 RepID=UPI002454354C|nr:PEP/pyruvate-binding domain-containing protein [Nocardia neocaledoniensis]
MTSVDTLGAAASADRAEVLILSGTGLSGSLVGGKAAALDRLIGWGVRVPAAACVTAAAYRVVARRPEVAELLTRLERGESALASEVDAAFSRAGLPRTILDEVCAVAARVGAGKPVAVRSSATVEDMDASSFAGQYHSVLDVDPADRAAVESAVLSVFSSLHHPAPRAYRRALGIGDADVAMAALIMAMVPPVRAGVLFTQDPTGATGTARIETVHGLAETLVSGKQTPRVLLVSDGKVPTEAPAEATELVAVAREIEQRAGCPQDIEWAWDGLRLWIVQARPITVRAADEDPFDTAARDLTGSDFTTEGIAEMLPGVLPPLRWDVCSFVVEEALRAMFDGLGTRPLDTMTAPHRLLVRRHGRAALHAGATGSAIAPNPASRGLTDRVATIRHRARAARVRRRAVFDADVAIHAAEEIDRTATILANLGEDELCRYHLALIDLATRAMAAEITVAADAGAIHEGLRLLLARFGPAEDAARLAAAATVPESVIVPSPRASMAIPVGPTWAESGQEPPTGSPHAVESAAVDTVMEMIDAGPRRPRTDIGRWVRLRQVERLTHEARAQFERRERAKAAILLLGGEIRRVHLDLGRRLVRDGVLESASDVELLTAGEFRAAARTKQVPVPAVLDRRRRRVLRQEQLDPLPQRFRGDSDSAAPAEAATGRQLRGWAAGNGRFRGVARRVTRPDQPLNADEVLLATTTDPSWAPLLMRCGAMVIEQGGPLSHAAILAREFGVPAVFNLPGVARALDGRLVEVDGTAGTVTLLDEGPSDDDQFSA